MTAYPSARPSTRRLLRSALALGLAGIGAYSACAQVVTPTSNPNGATFDNPDANTTNITAPNNAIIEYNQFNIGAGQTVEFIQPSAQSRVLNRVTGAVPSQIEGNLVANGIVYLVNPAGVTFGQNSVTNVGSLYAAAGNLSDADFQNGIDNFTGITGDVTVEAAPPGPNDDAEINIAEGGFAVLLGDTASNFGTINAPKGAVALLSGTDILVTHMDGRRGLVFAQITPSGNASDQSGTVDTDVQLTNDAAGTPDVQLVSGDVFGVIAINGDAEILDGNTAAGANQVNEADLEAAAAAGDRIIVSAINGQVTSEALTDSQLDLSNAESANFSSTGAPGNDVNLTNTAEITTDGSLSLSSEQNVNAGALISTGSAVSIEAGGTIAAGTITGDTDVTLTGPSGIDTGDITATNGAVLINDPFSAGSSVTVQSGTTLGFDTFEVTGGGSNATLTAGTTLGGGTVTADTDVTLTGPGGIDTGDITATNGAVVINNPFSTTNAVDITAGTSLTADAISALGGVTLTGQGITVNGITSINGARDAGGAVDVNNTSALFSLGAVDAFGLVDIASTGANASDVSLFTSINSESSTVTATLDESLNGGAVTGDGNVSVTAAGDDLTVGDTTSNTGSASLIASNGSLNGGTVDALGGVTLTGQGITVNGITSINGARDAGGAVDVNNTSALFSLGTVDAFGLVDIASTGANASDVSLFTSINSESSTVTATLDESLNGGAVTGDGNVSVTAAGDDLTVGDTTSNTGSASLIANNGSLNGGAVDALGGVTLTGQGITVNGITSTDGGAGGNILVTNTNTLFQLGTVNADGSVTVNSSGVPVADESTYNSITSGNSTVALNLDESLNGGAITADGNIDVLGNANPQAGDLTFGGGIDANGGTVTISGSTISGNTVNGLGGVSITGQGITVTDVTAINGARDAGGAVTLNNTDIDANPANDGELSVNSVDAFGSVDIDSVKGVGGPNAGAFASLTSESGNVDLDAAEGVSGGDIFADAGTVTIVGSTISGNDVRGRDGVAITGQGITLNNITAINDPLGARDAGGDITVTNSDSAFTLGALDAFGDVTINTTPNDPAAASAFTSIVSETGSVTLDGGAAGLGGTSVAAPNTDGGAGGGITINDLFTTAGDTTLSFAGTLNHGTIESTGGGITLVAGAGSVGNKLDADTFIDITGTYFGPTGIDFDAGTSIDFDSINAITQGVDLNAGTTLTGTTVNGVGDVVLMGQAVSLTTVASSNGALTITNTAGAMGINTIQGRGLVTVTNNGALSSFGSATSVDGSVVINGGANGLGGTTVTANADNSPAGVGDITVTGLFQTAGNTTLNANNTIDFGGATIRSTGGTVQLIADAGIAGGNARADGDLTITDNGGGTTTLNNVTSDNGDVIVNGSNGSIALNDLMAGGTFTFTSPLSDLTFNDLTLGNGGVTLNNADVTNLTVNGDILVTGGDVAIDRPGNPLALNDVTSNDGMVTLVGSTITANDISGMGDVSLTGGTDVSFGLLTSTAGDVMANAGARIIGLDQASIDTLVNAGLAIDPVTEVNGQFEVNADGQVLFVAGDSLGFGRITTQNGGVFLFAPTFVAGHEIISGGGNAPVTIGSVNNPPVQPNGSGGSGPTDKLAIDIDNIQGDPINLFDAIPTIQQTVQNIAPPPLDDNFVEFDAGLAFDESELEALQAMGIVVRAMRLEEWIEIPAGRLVVNDLPANPGELTTQDYFIAVYRMNPGTIRQTLQQYRAIFETTDEDGATTFKRDADIRQRFLDAFTAYADAGNDVGENYDPAAFRRFVANEHDDTQLARDFDQLRALLQQIDRLGLNDVEEQISIRKIVESVTPQGTLSVDQVRELLLASTEPAAEPAETEPEPEPVARR